MCSLITASVRRGYEVYKQVCKACHSLQYIAFRNLVDVTHTEEEAKAEAAEVSISFISLVQTQINNIKYLIYKI